MKSVTVGKNDAGQRVDRFLMKTFPQLPVSMLYKYIRQKDIKRNGKRCQIADRLAENDVVTVYAPDEFLEPAARKFEFMSAGKALDILYEDEHLLLLNKPAGLWCIPMNMNTATLSFIGYSATYTKKVLISPKTKTALSLRW